MEREYNYITTLPRYVWRRMALLVGGDCTEDTLYQDVSATLLAAYGYISSKGRQANEIVAIVIGGRVHKR